MDSQKTLLSSRHRVLDLCEGKGHLCGKMLGDLGADVIQIERPGGDPARNIGSFYGDIADPEKSLWWFAFNMHKRGITLDIETETGRETFKRLVREADFVIESFEPGYLDRLGLGYEELEKINPRTILVSVTAFGQTGPYAHYKGPDIVQMSMGGQVFMSGDDDRPPVQISYPHAWQLAAMHACVGAVNAHYYREETGEGQHVDASGQASIVCTNHNANVTWDLLQVNPTRGGAIRTGIQQNPDGSETEVSFRMTYPCKDGYILSFFMGGPVTGPRMKVFVDWMDEEGMAPEWMKTFDWTNDYDMATVHQELIDRTDEVVIPFLMKHTMAELYEGALKRIFWLVPIGTPKSVFEDKQLAYRKFWEKIEHPELNATLTYPGWPIKQSKTPWRVQRRAPLVGEHNEEILGNEQITAPEKTRTRHDAGRTGPVGKRRGGQIFEGVKVLDLTWVVVGPLTIRNLADHGAFVIHVESHTKPDPIRVTGPYQDREMDINKAAFFANYNTSKYGISLNLNKKKGRDLIKRILLEWKPDIIAESYAPKAMKKWGLDYEHVKEIRPDIIYYSATQQGSQGPHSHFAGFGQQASALGGYAHITGWPDRLPAIPYGAYTDFISPFCAGPALVAALDYRRKTGKGQFLDLSQYECGQQLLAPALMDYALTRREICRMGNRQPDAAPHGVFPCKEEETWCCIAVFTDEEWQAFCSVIGDPPWTRDEKYRTLAGRKENEDKLESLVAEWTLGFTPVEVMAMMQDEGVPAGVVHPISGLFEDPQLKHRGYFVELDHTEMEPHHYDGFSFNLSKTPGKHHMPAPCLGEHNEYIYSEVLGLSDDEISDLLMDGVITTEADLPWEVDE
jgi:crotonobetainyl-CoA:carnitine CoA-transferase CaiB-like acyl-CoA transferase